MMSFSTRASTQAAGVRRRLARLSLSALSWMGVGAALLPTVAAPVCAIQGRDGTTFSGNTYYAGVGSVSAGSTTVTLGTERVDGNASTTDIAAGDLVFIIQMQDASINNTNSGVYGDGSTGRGATGLNSSGRYEFARVKSVSGSVLTLSQALTYTYTTAAATTSSGQKRFQVIRVPQNSSLASGNLTKTSPPAWNGTTGGVLVLDVAGTFNTTGVTLDASALGFRGGGSVQNGSLTGQNRTDYTASFQGVNAANVGAFKGEGIAGTPRYVRGTGSTAFNGVDLTTSGYPNSLDIARGAPGNAGGGGTQHNAGGGGGSNAGQGGQGGYSYGTYSATDTGGCKQLQSGSTTYYSCGGDGSRNVGGLGGGTVAPSTGRLILGGGGGAGDNNDAGDNGSTPQGSGGNGGGLIFVRAQTISGSGTIRANGQDGQAAGRDGAGGGGAGGTVALVTASTSLSLTVEARGGKGGNSGKPLRDNETQGPGGGGGGGAVLLPAGTSLSNINLAGGAAGLNRVSGTNGDLTNTYGSAAGAGQTSTIALDSSNIGLPSDCRPVLTVAKTTSTPSRKYGVDSTATYSVTVTNSGGGAAGLNITDVLPAPFTYTAASVTPTYTGDASSANTSFTPVTGSGSVSSGVTTVTFGTAGGTSSNSFTLPPSSSVTLTFSVNLTSSAVPGTTYQNPASINFLDPTRTSASTTVTPGATYTAGGSVGGSNYASASSTGEDVTITANIVIACTTPVGVSSSNTGSYLYTLTGSGYTTLTQVWTLAQGSYAVGRAPDGVIYYVGNGNGNLYYFDPGTGTGGAVRNPSNSADVVITAPTTGGLTTTVTRLAVDAGGKAYVITGNGTVYSFPTSGRSGNTPTTTVTTIGQLKDRSGTAVSATAGGDLFFDNDGMAWAVMTDLVTGSPTVNQSVLWRLDLTRMTSTNLNVATPIAAIAVGGVVSTTNPLNGIVDTGSGLIVTDNNGRVSAFDLGVANITSGAAISPTLYDLATCTYRTFRPNLAVEKTVSPTTAVRSGASLTYTVKVTNTGNAPATSVQLADPIPANTTYTAGSTTLNGTAQADTSGTMPYATAAAVKSAGTGTAYVYPGAALAAGNTATVQFRVTVNPSLPAGVSTVTNTATMTYDLHTGATGTANASVTTNVILPPNITLTKLGRNVTPGKTTAFIDQNGSLQVAPTETVEYCLIYRNTGGPASNFRVTDNIPAGMVAQMDAYGTGQGLKWAAGTVMNAGDTTPPSSLAPLTSASDSDQGTLTTSGGKFGRGVATFSLGATALAANGTGTVCFQAKVP